MTSKLDKAQQIADALEEYGVSARIWEGTVEDIVRVYVSRQLGRGRQDIGYVEIGADGSVSNALTRNRAGLSRAAGIDW